MGQFFLPLFLYLLFFLFFFFSWMKSHVTLSGLELLPLLPLPMCLNHHAQFPFPFEPVSVSACTWGWPWLKMRWLNQRCNATPGTDSHWLSHIEHSELHFPACRHQWRPVPESVCSCQKSPFTICSFSCGGWVAKGMWQKRKVRRVSRKMEEFCSWVCSLSILVLQGTTLDNYLNIIVKFIWAATGHPAHRDE